MLPRPASMRLRALGTALSVIGVAGIAAAAPASGSGDLHHGLARAGSTTATAGPVPDGDGVAARRRRRAGCHQFCQQAGGLGGDPTLAPITISRGPVRLRAGVARIYVRCLATTVCDGALVIFPSHSADIVAGGVPRGSFGGVDLAAPPRRTVAIEIPVAAAARRLIQHRARVYVDVLAELKGTPVQARDRHITLLPERR
jgi:hypothetical protein